MFQSGWHCRSAARCVNRVIVNYEAGHTLGDIALHWSHPEKEGGTDVSATISDNSHCLPSNYHYRAFLCKWISSICHQQCFHDFGNMSNSFVIGSPKTDERWKTVKGNVTFWIQSLYKKKRLLEKDSLRKSLFSAWTWRHCEAVDKNILYSGATGTVPGVE